MCLQYLIPHAACPTYPTSPIQTYKDSVYNRCVQNCSTGPSYFAYNETNSCVEFCPSPYWADENLMVCVIDCAIGSYYQIDGSERTCVDTCYPNYYADLNRSCVNASTCPSSPQRYFADDYTGKCITSTSRHIQPVPPPGTPSVITPQAGASSIAPSAPLLKTTPVSVSPVQTELYSLPQTARSVRKQYHQKLPTYVQ